ncbi:MAG: histidine phosphatase family protein [Propionibacteriaceae bacterium]|nr:histidine phosphatase family protein [Propionibacteriaceae bacterium]
MRIAHATRLVVLRHGETDHNAQGRFQGHADIPINAKGRRQAEAARERLAHRQFDAVYTSTLIRAVETARIVRPGAELIEDARLMEINVGSWAGLTWAEVQAQMPDYEQKYADGIDFRRSPEGETLGEVVERGHPALLEIAERHDGGTVLIVSHGLFLNRVLHSLLGIEGRVLGSITNAHWSELGYAHGAWRLLAHNVG